MSFQLAYQEAYWMSEIVVIIKELLNIQHVGSSW